MRFVSPTAGTVVAGAWPIEIATDVAKVDRVDFFVDGALAGVARKQPYRIAHDFGASLEPRTITAKVWGGGYRTSESATIVTAALTAGESITVDLVEVPLRVRAARALRAEDLRVRENGVEQRIREIKAGRGAAHFAFVVDRSLSMGEGKLAAALAAVAGAMKLLRAGDTASLVLFNHTVARPRTIATGDDLEAVAARTTPSGGTSLRDAIASIPSSQRTYAFVITDGGDRNSALSDEAALRKISTTRTTIFSLVLGSSHARFLDRAAKNTGGAVVDVSRETVARAMQKLVTDINSRYTLAYQSAGTAKGWRKIDIAARRGGIEIVSARKGYFAE